MNAEHWGNVIARITLHDAINIDDLTGPMDPRRNPVGRAIFPDAVQLPVEGMPFNSEDMTAIGCRISEPLEDIAQVALSLATLAMEKEVEVIIFNHLDHCSLERFGFRCERITGDTPEEREACEEQIRRFWGIDFVM